ncbi:MAG: hypothetical protein B6241_00420 [Spirochaetaceae bacterium 4572_59]|nr:MAG: hypothetical protein B6241_00420 [Spirochaetaceae bacterium 4572_59]
MKPLLSFIKPSSSPSIAGRLFRIFIIFYLFITIFLTVIQMTVSYRMQRQKNQLELKNIQRVFEAELAIDLWHLNSESFISTIEGIRKLPVVSGIKIINEDGIIIVHSGLVQIDEVLTETEPHIQILGVEKKDYELHRISRNHYGAFSHSFPLHYQNKDFNKNLGQVILYSDMSITLHEMQSRFLLIITATTIKIILMWLVSHWLFNNFLKKPLYEFTTATSKISLNNLKSFRIQVETGGENELKLLKDSFNSMIGNLNDSIEEKEEANDRARVLQNYLSNIIDSMPSVIIGVDPEYKITQWNVSAEKYSRSPGEISRGCYLPDLFPLLKPDLQNIARSLDNKEIIREQYRKIQLNDGIEYHNLIIYPLIANGISGAVIRLDNVTKEFELEEQLRHSQKMDAIGQLAGGVAHDFNNALVGILGGAEILLPYISGNPSAEKFHRMIMQSAERASLLTQKLLSFSRKQFPCSTIIDIHEILRETSEILKSTIDLRIQIYSSFQAGTSTVTGDPSLLQSLFLNLGINASHAITGDGIISFISSNLDLDEDFCNASAFDIEPGRYIQIEIRDSGKGIAPENLDKIFDPFFTTKKQGKGTGLGLSTAFGTATQHKGSITVSSIQGRGTSFFILLPITIDRVSMKPENSQIAEGSGKILLIDDEEVVRITAKVILEELGYEVVMSEDGYQGLEVLRAESEHIDLVILDMIMPNMGGRDCLTGIRKIAPEMPVILSSGFSQEEDLKEVKKMGISGFISKPYTKSAIGMKIQEAFKKFNFPKT